MFNGTKLFVNAARNAYLAVVYTIVHIHTRASAHEQTDIYAYEEASYGDILRGIAFGLFVVKYGCRYWIVSMYIYGDINRLILPR